MSNILITGYKGFIGQNMVNALSSEHTLSLYEWGEEHPPIQGLDLIIHLGAISSTAETDVNKILTQNLDYSKWLLDQAIEHHVHFQWASTAGLYGKNSSTFRESDPPQPLTPYAWSKYLFERHIEQLGETPIRVQGFRYFNVYGPHEDHKCGQSSPHHAFTEQAKNDQPIVVFEGSEHFKRDFVPVERVVDIHKKFMNVSENGVWNAGSGFPKSFMSVAKTIAEEYGVPIKTVPFPDHLKGTYQEYTCANLRKLKQSLSDAGLQLY